MPDPARSNPELLKAVRNLIYACPSVRELGSSEGVWVPRRFYENLSAAYANAIPPDEVGMSLQALVRREPTDV